MLPERIATAVRGALEEIGVRVACSEQVVEVAPGDVKTRNGNVFPADLTVWAAGIKGANILKNLDGLETSRINQLVILPTLQTTRDPDVFALGDCSVYPREEGGAAVPPTAQAAHQQASHLARTIARRLEGQPPAPFRYRDFGSLVSLGEYSTIGSLMGFLSGKSYRVEGWFARFMYLSLYKMHLYALHGPIGVILDTLARLLKRGTEPRVKLH
jgi:NADH:ubiquinone reductase (H+-translocating)